VQPLHYPVLELRVHPRVFYAQVLPQEQVQVVFLHVYHVDVGCADLILQDFATGGD
jgi:hypothetical protein